MSWRRHAREGRLDCLPRCGPKQVAKILQGIADYRKTRDDFFWTKPKWRPRNSRNICGRLPGIERVTTAGSLRRGRETVGDLDFLVTGPALCRRRGATRSSSTWPPIRRSWTDRQGTEQGELPSAPRLAGGCPHAAGGSYGAALQYFTGSKMHNVALRQRALKMGYTLNEYALARLDDGSVRCRQPEEEIYRALGLDWIPPELRENWAKSKPRTSTACRT